MFYAITIYRRQIFTSPFLHTYGNGAMFKEKKHILPLQNTIGIKNLIQHGRREQLK